ncbi:MAG: hypothetical protein EBR30_21850 [Cytophagia bacterium]|nr:hypothetical protein [Cytophagia bacterium]
MALCLLVTSCDLIKRKTASETDNIRPSVARVGETYLYQDELTGIVPPGTPREDSITRMDAYVNSWVRKQLLIRQAGRQIDINKAEVERKLLDYRYSLIAYEFQTYYIKQNLDTVVANSEIEQYYNEHLDNFVLKQNIVRATFLKVPQSAPRTKKIKDLIYSNKPKDVEDEYRISDNVSPLQFVRDDIVNVILNRRKVELAKKLDDEVYSKAQENNEFELFNK